MHFKQCQSGINEFKHAALLIFIMCVAFDSFVLSGVVMCRRLGSSIKAVLNFLCALSFFYLFIYFSIFLT